MQRRISKIMSREVVHLPAEASVREAARLMAERRIGAVLILEGGRLAGIFTERDALARVLAAGRDPETTALAEVMTGEPIVVAPDTRALDALRLLRDRGFRHLPVVERGAVVGMLSLRDFLGVELSQIEDEAAFQARIAEGPGQT